MYFNKYSKYKNKYLNLKRQKTNDVKQILNIAKTKRVFAMGEAMHGLDKITQFRIAIFKKLVKYCDYTVFILEEQFSCCELINEYIKGKPHNPLNLMINLMWAWKSQYILNLIKWMKKYNKENNNILEFKGIDINYICPDYNKQTDQIAELAKNLHNMRQELESKRNIEFDDPNIFLSKNEIDDSNFRDKSMFKIFMKLYDPSKKYFIFAGNGHVEKDNEDYLDKNDIIKFIRFGHYLYNEFENDYYTIGNTFFGSSYLGFNMDTPNEFNLEIANFGDKFDLSKITVLDNKSQQIKKIDKNLIFYPKSGLNFIINKIKNLFIITGGSSMSKSDPYKFLWGSKIDNKFDAIYFIPNDQALNIIK